MTSRGTASSGPASMAAMTTPVTRPNVPAGPPRVHDPDVVSSVDEVDLHGYSVHARDKVLG